MKCDKSLTRCLKNCKLPDLIMNVLNPSTSKKHLENEQGSGEHTDEDKDNVPICDDHSKIPDETKGKDAEQLRISFAKVTAEKIFASVAIIKAYYALLQLALFPYKPPLVMHADKVIVNEFGSLSSMLRSFHGRGQLETPAEELSSAMSRHLSACITSYMVLVKKLKLQTRAKDSQLCLLREEMEKITAAGYSISVSNTEEEGFEKLKIMRMSYFDSELQVTIELVRHFVKLMANEMLFAGWDIDAAAEALQPGVMYWRENDTCFAFEAYICSEMFQSFQVPNFCLSKEALPHPNLWRRYFAQKYLELKSMKPRDYLSKYPVSSLATFFKSRYQRVISPKMELSFFGNINFRNYIKLGGLPEALFVNSFLEMAKQVLCLHYLALSLDPDASIFQVRKGSQFSEIYMEGVHQDPFLSAYSPSNAAYRVSFTVVPGFTLCQTIFQSQVYFSKPPAAL